MATTETITLNAPHAPHENAIEAFTIILPTLKKAIIKSRHDWDKHEPKMWSRAAGLSNEALTKFDIKKDLVEIRSGVTAYGTVILGKIRIPAIKDDEGEGFIHVRIHDPPNRGAEDVIFHSLFTDERHKEGEPSIWRAIQTADTPLEFFNE
ncbi:hypothetical protein Hypma_007699 [Hypsizygus marmoreus]|uniref:Uncharacterized protein n=1 Tax=Hypsizygus marmoreus TaxID=39966 RepID=A0A369JU76_HYPMA|nr:hypothetical protein Hypma_007699 [Hypsizygus marmoreus]